MPNQIGTSREAAAARSRGREPMEWVSLHPPFVYCVITDADEIHSLKYLQHGQKNSREAAIARRSRMGTYTKLAYHVVFSTKYRRRIITDEIRERLYEYIGGVVRRQNGRLVEIGGVEDHVHLLVRFPPTITFSDAIREIKANTSKWVNELPDLKVRFEWQKGYAAFTVSHSRLESVRSYIQNQRQHHERLSFEDEYMLILERHGIEFDRDQLFESEVHD